MNTTTSLKYARALSASLVLLSSAHAGVDLNGEVKQSLDAAYSPITGVATGVNARAHASVNEIEGNVAVKGDLSQTANLKYSPVTAVATGVNAKATARANSIRSNP